MPQYLIHVWTSASVGRCNALRGAINDHFLAAYPFESKQRSL